MDPFTENYGQIIRFGFKISGHSSTLDLFVDSEESLLYWLPHLQHRMINLNIEDDYIFIKEIGKGNFGFVFEGETIDKTSRVAIKSITKSMVKRQYLENIVRETEILRNMQHQNIVNIIRVYESEDSVHFVMDYVEGGDLHSSILAKGKFSEREVSKFANKFLKLLVFMRGKGLLHRDLKPANILLVKKHRITDFKLCDFGFAEMVPKSGLSLLCGSPGYVAPEILNNENYSFQADIFSFGVILYIL